MLPYIHVNDIMIGGLPLHPFGLLVATGVLIGTALATWRAKQRGLDLDKLNSFITWMLLAGFIGGHMLDTIFYHPTEIAKIENGHFQFTRPWSLLLLYEGLSSFGGFVGATTGIIMWKYLVIRPHKVGPLSIPWFARREGGPLPVIPFCDVIISVFPVAWVFGRTGCTVVHDHPGALAPHDSLLAVGYPDRRQTYDSFIELVHGPVARYDLGLLELMFTIVLATLFALTWGKRLPTGSYLVAAALSYGPVRFAMDYLRIADTESSDPRYGGLTPAQWCCLALTAVGVILYFVVIRKQKATGIDPSDALVVTEPPEVSDGTTVPVE